MTPDAVTQALRDALFMCFALSAPLLVVAFVAGILVSLAQILTSIQDSAFNAVPRLAAVLLAAILGMPWMLHKVTGYAASILGNLSRYGH